jgi:hypothetical protein
LPFFAVTSDLEITVLAILIYSNDWFIGQILAVNPWGIPYC